MKHDHIHIDEELKRGSLYSEDLAPIPEEERTWGLWDMTAIWVGMAVCVPTYMLASFMIKSGLSWMEALIIIILGNIVITIPMVLNGHAGVKFGLPFPVIGRAAFGTLGIHLASVARGLVACGWFGIQTWVGGLAFYELYHALAGSTSHPELSFGKFIAFALFWLINVFFIWKGTESIKWLEKFAAPILIAMGLALIAWGTITAGSFSTVLQQSEQLAQPSLVLEGERLSVNPLVDKEKKSKVSEYALVYNVLAEEGQKQLPWKAWTNKSENLKLSSFLDQGEIGQIEKGNAQVGMKFRGIEPSIESSTVMAVAPAAPSTFGSRMWTYIFWLTTMVGFWATMAISIADITRYTKTQRNQVLGQFLGLPGTMALFSFVGIFVTCAAVINFQDVLIANDAPWEPASLLGKFSNPMVVIVAQIFLIIATLSTNIAANVIAPANAFSNIAPKAISFRTGGIITAMIGIIICPWWIMGEIADLLIFVSGFLGPVLAILVADYYVIRKTEINVVELYKENGIYSYSGGFNVAALIALFVGVLLALIGYFVKSLEWLYTLSWFTGFAVSFIIYCILMWNSKKSLSLNK